MYFAGLDAHLAYVAVAVVDKSGTLLLERRVSTRKPEELVATLRTYPGIEAVVETCPCWPWIYDLLTAAGIPVHVAHAKELRAIATSHRKTDERDAALLARMLAAGLIPKIHPKARAQRDAATLLRHRALLVRQRTAFANRVHAQLHQSRLTLRRGQLLRQATRAWLKTDAWPRFSREQRRAVRGSLQLITRLTRMIRALDRVIAVRAAAAPAVAVLNTIPGIGPYRGLLLATELTPITRFPTPAHLASYAGLAPSTRRSAHHARPDPGRRQSSGPRSSGRRDSEPCEIRTNEFAECVLQPTESTLGLAHRARRDGAALGPRDLSHAAHRRNVARMTNA